MALQPLPQRARGESEDGGGGAAESMRVPDVAGRQAATAQINFGSPWLGLASNLPQASSEASVLRLCVGSWEG